MGLASSGGGASFSVEDLADAGDACPVDLDGAATEAGLATDPGGAEVEVIEGSGDGGPEASPMDQVGDVYVECNQLFEGGESLVTAVLVATESPTAAAVLGPQLVSHARLTTDQVIDVLEQAEETDEGTQVDLGTDASVAMVSVEVGDADSTMLLVRRDEASPDQIETITDQLVDEL